MGKIIYSFNTSTSQMSRTQYYLRAKASLAVVAV